MTKLFFLSECGNLVTYKLTRHRKSLLLLGLNHLFLLWDATDNAALHHEEGAMTAEVKSMNTSAVRIAPGITNHPHVAMNMTQNAANQVETEVGGAVVTTRTDVKRAKSAVQCILSMTFHLPTL
jgi:hypothetical protein